MNDKKRSFLVLFSLYKTKLVIGSDWKYFSVFSGFSSLYLVWKDMGTENNFLFSGIIVLGRRPHKHLADEPSPHSLSKYRNCVLQFEIIFNNHLSLDCCFVIFSDCQWYCFLGSGHSKFFFKPSLIFSFSSSLSPFSPHHALSSVAPPPHLLAAVNNKCVLPSVQKEQGPDQMWPVIYQMGRKHKECCLPSVDVETSRAGLEFQQSSPTGKLQRKLICFIFFYSSDLTVSLHEECLEMKL